MQLELSLRDDLSFVELPEGGGAIRGGAPPQIDVPFKQLSPGWRAALQKIAAGPTAEHALTALVLEKDGPASLFQFSQFLPRLVTSGLLCQTLVVAERPLATLVPLAKGYRFQPKLAQAEQPYTLSRFAYTRKLENRLALESPLGYARVLLHDERAMALYAALSRSQTEAELAERAALAVEDVNPFLNFLLNAQAIIAVGEDGRLLEESDPALAQWEFHDLLFHSRTRLGRHNHPYGGVYTFRGQFDPLPPVKPVTAAEIILLDKPDLEQLKADDLTFTAVMEQRRSLRDQGEQPLTVQQLGEFLYRTARVKQTFDMGEGDSQVTLRPYPTGGALYELEIYLVVDRCQGLESGLYHYDPQEHRLSKLSGRNVQLETILHLAWLTANRQSKPQVCLQITARFQRVQWKYRSICYSLVLKHTGVLFQTMYLVATAMGLAPCALGGGDSDLFAAAAGLDYYAETSVGEFILGSQAGSNRDVSGTE